MSYISRTGLRYLFEHAGTRSNGRLVHLPGTHSSCSPSAGRPSVFREELTACGSVSLDSVFKRACRTPGAREVRFRLIRNGAFGERELTAAVLAPNLLTVALVHGLLTVPPRRDLGQAYQILSGLQDRIQASAIACVPA